MRKCQHGLTKTSFYSRWKGLNQRCNNKNHLQYKDYGGRGIKCEWTSFDEFKKDMYDSYLEHSKINTERNTVIDRINNDCNYCLQNCHWTTHIENHQNKRKNKLVEYNGKKQTIACWCRELSIPYRRTVYRLSGRTDMRLFTVTEAFELQTIR